VTTRLWDALDSESTARECIAMRVKVVVIEHLRGGRGIEVFYSTRRSLTRLSRSGVIACVKRRKRFFTQPSCQCMFRKFSDQYITAA